MVVVVIMATRIAIIQMLAETMGDPTADHSSAIAAVIVVVLHPADVGITHLTAIQNIKARSITAKNTRNIVVANILMANTAHKANIDSLINFISIPFSSLQ